MPTHLLWTRLPAAALLLTLVAACGDKAETTDTAGGTDTTGASTGTSATSSPATESATAGSTEGSTSDTEGGTGGADGLCEDANLHYDPWLWPLGPSDEPCAFDDHAEACVTADDLPGYRLCLAFEIVEDMTESSWGPCMPSCDAGDEGSAQACGEGDVGVRYCGELSLGGETAHAWYPCLEAACVDCEPGATRLCGPDTPYPETVISCGLSGGIPVWRDGDCYT